MPRTGHRASLAQDHLPARLPVGQRHNTITGISMNLGQNDNCMIVPAVEEDRRQQHADAGRGHLVIRWHTREVKAGDGQEQPCQHERNDDRRCAGSNAKITRTAGSHPKRTKPVVRVPSGSDLKVCSDRIRQGNFPPSRLRQSLLSDRLFEAGIQPRHPRCSGLRSRGPRQTSASTLISAAAREAAGPQLPGIPVSVR